MIPKQIESHSTGRPLPFGQTHPSDTPCPFAQDKRPVGWINTCCSCSIAELTKILLERNELASLALLQKRGDVDFVRSVGAALREVCARVDAERGRHDAPPQDFVPSEVGSITLSYESSAEFKRSWGLDAARITLEQVTNWYEKVGNLGFGVESWF